MENNNETYVLRSAINGPDVADASPIFSKSIGEHPVKAKVQILYALEKMPKGEQKASKDLFHKFYATYYFGSACEGKTESLAWNLNSWQSVHEITVNTNFIADIYENPITFTLYEVIKGENATRSSIQTKYEQFGNDFKTFKGGWATSGDKKNSLEALAKRKFSLAQSGVSKGNKHGMSVKQFTAISEAIRSETDLTSAVRPPSSSGSSRSTTPHPHHFQHPEKHIEIEAGSNSMKKSRSASSLAALKTIRPKTPPSPHHGNHPLNILAPPGTVFVNDSIHATLTATPLTNEMIRSKQQEFFSKLNGDKKKAAEKIENIDDAKCNKDIEVQEHQEDIISSKTEQQGKRKGTVKFDELPSKERKNPLQNYRLTSPAKSSNSGSARKKESVTVPVAKVTMDLAELFLGQTEIKTAVNIKIEGMKYLSFSIQLDQPLLSPEQFLILNPMCINIQSADNMPSNPNGYSYLDQNCQRVFCKFRFLGDPHIHESFSRDNHKSKIRFNTKHLVLPGLIDEDKLCEDLLRKDFKVEVHDRDPRLPDDLSELAREIGPDGKLNTNTNAIAPYGIAEFDLSELATGITQYESTAQIIPYEPRTRDFESLPPAHWLENFSSLTVSITLPYSILTKSVHLGSSCSFGYFTRLAIIAQRENMDLYRRLREFIDDTNAKALGLDEKSVGILLSGYKLSPKEQKSASLDILSGYQIFDDASRIFLLEGINGETIENMIKLVEEFSDVQIFHNVETTFSTRLWKLFSPGLCHIQVKNIQYLIKDTCNRQMANFIFDLYSKIPSNNKLLGFPNASTIYSLLVSHGQIVPEEEAGKNSESIHVSVVDSEKQSETLLAVKNPSVTLAYIMPPAEFMARVRSTPKRVQDRNPQFHAEPKRAPNFVNLYSKKKGVVSDPYPRSNKSTVFNYSIQTKSSTASQLEKLRSLAIQDSKYIHAYGPHLYSPAIPLVTESPKAKKYDFWPGPFKKA